MTLLQKIEELMPKEKKRNVKNGIYCEGCHISERFCQCEGYNNGRYDCFKALPEVIEMIKKEIIPEEVKTEEEMGEKEDTELMIKIFGKEKALCSLNDMRIGWNACRKEIIRKVNLLI